MDVIDVDHLSVNLLFAPNQMPITSSKFASYDSRVKSFADWSSLGWLPEHSDLCTDHWMAMCGLHSPIETYSLPDTAVCFVCGVAVDGWSESDNPFTRHHSANPNCAWLRTIGCTFLPPRCFLPLDDPIFNTIFNTFRGVNSSVIEHFFCVIAPGRIAFTGGRVFFRHLKRLFKLHDPSYDRERRNGPQENNI
jgi:hypothetical protein